jgi:hypothetical protein
VVLAISVIRAQYLKEYIEDVVIVAVIGSISLGLFSFTSIGKRLAAWIFKEDRAKGETSPD